MQAGDGKSVLAVVRGVVATDGVIGLWKGTTPSAVWQAGRQADRQTDRQNPALALVWSRDAANCPEEQRAKWLLFVECW
jgi:hypothetical protein